MKEQILKLREEGKTYKQIAEELNCAKSTVCYHLNEQTRKSTKERTQRNKNAQLSRRISAFTIENRKDSSKLRSASCDFTREGKDRRGKANYSFGYKDVIEKFGEDTVCYLTGRSINLYTDDFHFDHIVPLSRSGDITIDNLGIACPEANKAKSDKTPEEFMELCKEVLIHNGYTVTRE